jgi:hypothetical protein
MGECPIRREMGKLPAKGREMGYWLFKTWEMSEMAKRFERIAHQKWSWKI